ncbi:M28 family peptidase [Gemmatimonas groenlandica]|uniref:M28 family peptidase n=1 Tax=Gemmatimonas groenlandica TaxID=2732249 RepID=A0A6M4IPV2_9BACT|nr:M28 family peptidase [Gemmatimonas groenlandica]QJR36954.1 M28 family peptidase [Gemmatimonas groenlandica]
MSYFPRFTRPARAVALLALSLPAGAAVAQGKPVAKPSAPSPAMAPITRAVSAAISGDRALRTVDYVQRYFRLPGNRGFDLAIDTVASLLRVAGYVDEASASPTARLVYRIESRPMRDLAWTPEGASITIVGQPAPLQSWPKNLNMIAINSVSTAPDGVTAAVVDVGAGAEADFAAVDVKGKIVLAEGNARSIFVRAMQKGAVGVLAAQKLPEYNQQSKNVTSIQFTGIARDTLTPGWLLFVSRASRDALKSAITRGPVSVHVVVKTLLESRPERTLVAEIRGASVPSERFMYSAHVQEPGANDNATGVGTLAEMARVAAQLVKAGTANPKRTVTFLWGDEIRSTDRYIKEDSVRRIGVKWGMSLDMVGENTAKTGGTFLIEKMPDPSAVWVRGEDKHSEWGGRPLAEKDIRAHWFNDFVRQRCLDRAAQTGWVVKANPFEGGSDHTPFLNAQIPAVLLWHFTDQHYHTDLDRIDMVSAASLGNVGSCALTTGLLLADGSRPVVLAALEELTRAAEKELATQKALGRDTLSRGGTVETEHHIIDAWRDFYLGAIDRIPDIAVGPMELGAALSAAKDRVRKAALYGF